MKWLQSVHKPKINRQSLTRFTGHAAIRLVMYALLIGLAFVFLYPFLYMIVTSIKSPVDLTDISVQWLVNEVHTANYQLAWQVLDYPRRFLNTAGVTVLAVLGHVLSCSFVGYGFARYQFRFKGFWFAALLLSIIVPVETIIVPIYIVFVRLGWADTYLPMLIPSFLGFGLRGGLYIFLFRQFFTTLPRSLEEAASIDGCGPIRTFFKVALPNSRSSILVCTVLGLVWHWNDVFEPSIFISRQDDFFLPQMLPTLYAVISDMAQQMNTSEVTAMFNDAVAMAATVLVVAPLIVMYLLLQNKFMQSVERSGITG